jgi:hypothetical protein
MDIVNAKNVLSGKRFLRLRQVHRRQAGHGSAGFAVKVRMTGIMPAGHFVEVHPLIRRQFPDDPVLPERG